MCRPDGGSTSHPPEGYARAGEVGTEQAEPHAGFSRAAGGKYRHGSSLRSEAGDGGEMVPEAVMERRAGGLAPAGDGWFVVDAREAEWVHNEQFGAGVTFEGQPRFAHYGINIQVLWPGQPNGYYHAEEGQEDFLVL